MNELWRYCAEPKCHSFLELKLQSKQKKFENLSKHFCRNYQGNGLLQGN